MIYFALISPPLDKRRYPGPLCCVCIGVGIVFCLACFHELRRWMRRQVNALARMSAAPVQRLTVRLVDWATLIRVVKNAVFTAGSLDFINWCALHPIFLTKNNQDTPANNWDRKQQGKTYIKQVSEVKYSKVNIRGNQLMLLANGYMWKWFETTFMLFAKNVGRDSIDIVWPIFL